VIRKLVADGVLTKELGDWADNIRLIGNDAAHGQEVIRDDLEMARCCVGRGDGSWRHPVPIGALSSADDPIAWARCRTAGKAAVPAGRDPSPMILPRWQAPDAAPLPLLPVVLADFADVGDVAKIVGFVAGVEHVQELGNPREIGVLLLDEVVAPGPPAPILPLVLVAWSSLRAMRRHCRSVFLELVL
jgi:Domain of unknown function (DUF4145)